MSEGFSRGWRSWLSHLGAEADLTLGGGITGGTGHLDGNHTAEGPSLVAVGDLDQADIALAGHGAGAGSASGNTECHRLEEC